MKNLKRQLRKAYQVSDLDRESMSCDGEYTGVRAGVYVYQPDDTDDASEPDIIIRWFTDDKILVVDYYKGSLPSTADSAYRWFDKSEQDEAIEHCHKIMAHNRVHIHKR